MTTATRPIEGIVPLDNGAHMSAREFIERYEATEPSRTAELIEGVVYVASPLSHDHGDHHHPLAGWISVFCAGRSDVRGSDNATVKLDPRNVPQPDIHLRYVQSTRNRREGKYLAGAPELVAEVAVSSQSIDLHEKLEAYRRNGVQEYIVWRVYDGELDWLSLEDGQYVRLEPDASGVVNSKIFPGLRLAVQALLDGDMNTVLATQQNA
jgi:Uma2 family endonuclease